jgi:arylsulfatase
MGYRTPNIDRIANDGMRFTDSYGEQSPPGQKAASFTINKPTSKMTEASSGAGH